MCAGGVLETFHMHISEMPTDRDAWLQEAVLYWNYTPNPDAGERVGVYLNCIIDKPARPGNEAMLLSSIGTLPCDLASTLPRMDATSVALYPAYQKCCTDRTLDFCHIQPSTCLFIEMDGPMNKVTLTVLNAIQVLPCSTWISECPYNTAV